MIINTMPIPRPNTAGMDNLSINQRILDIIDVSYNTINRLNQSLQDGVSVPSEVHRLRDTTGRLHNILTSILHAQVENVGSLGRTAPGKALLDDLDLTRQVLRRLNLALDDVQTPAPRCSPVPGQTSYMTSMKARWSMQRHNILQLQADLDRCCHHILAKLIASNV